MYKLFPVMGGLWHCFSHITANIAMRDDLETSETIQPRGLFIHAFLCPLRPEACRGPVLGGGRGLKINIRGAVSFVYHMIVIIVYSYTV
jgi:hypothetical protein